MQKPKYNTTDNITRLVGHITKRVKNNMGRYRAYEQMTAGQRYHAVRIRDVYTTLAMNNDRLSLEQVTDVIEGKLGYTELAPDEILAISNAYEAYKQIYHIHFINLESTNPYSIAAMQDIHRIFMAGLSSESGIYRFDKRIESSMRELTSWLENSSENMLIKSCVFHYKLMRSKPFGEGSEYIARMWQILPLNQKKVPICRIGCPC